MVLGISLPGPAASLTSTTWHSHVGLSGIVPAEFFVVGVTSTNGGDLVAFHNHDNVTHRLADDGGEWLVTIPKGATGSIRYTTVGDYPFHCEIHPSMLGVVHVTTGNRRPFVGVSSPAPDSTVSGIISVQGNSGDPDGSVWVTQRRYPWAPVWTNVPPNNAASWTFRWDTRLLANGTYTFDVRAVDPIIAGRPLTTSVEVWNWWTPPAVDLTAPANGATVSGLIQARATAGAVVNEVGWVEFRLAGQAWKKGVLSGGVWSTSFDSRSLAATTIEARAWDLLGYGPSDGATVAISNPDLTVNSVSFSAPALGRGRATIEIANIGTAPSPLARLDVWLLGAGDQENRLVAAGASTPLAAGASRVVTLDFSTTNLVGRFAATVTIDGADVAIERDESNNARTREVCLPLEAGAQSCLIPGVAS